MTAFIRTVILYILIMAGLRLMGKRQIGQLEPSELVLTMMLSDLATVPMQDFGIPLLAGVIPILTLLSLSMLMSQLSLRSLRFRRLVCGTPTVLIHRGVIRQKAMRKNRYTLDELLEELREQGYSDLSEVKYAVLENSGQLSILPWASRAPITVWLFVALTTKTTPPPTSSSPKAPPPSVPCSGMASIIPFGKHLKNNFSIGKKSVMLGGITLFCA